MGRFREAQVIQAPALDPRSDLLIRVMGPNGKTCVANELDGNSVGKGEQVDWPKRPHRHLAAVG